MATNYLDDGVLDLSLGMNAGDLPQLLEPGEAAYILNGNISNGFLKTRPPENKVAIIAADQGTITSATSGYFYGACIYTSDQGVSSIMASIGGQLFRFTPQYDADGNALNSVLTDNQTGSTGGQSTDDSVNQHWLIQAERWVIWNDGVNLPIFWDGSASTPSARRSLGKAVPAGSAPELGAGRMMAYGQDQVWEALPDGYSFLFGDPVYYSSGTLAYNFRDAVLKLQINNQIVNGGNFRVPSDTGKITGFTFTALLDATLGTGPLQVFTQGAVHGCAAPQIPTSWAAGQTPLLTASLIGAGGCCPQNAPENGDIFFRSGDAHLRSLFMGRRDFNQWGMTPVSYEVDPFIQGDNQNLLYGSATVEFDNNILALCNPVNGPLGVYYQNMVCLSLAKVSGIQEKRPPAYNGLWSIGNVLSVLVGKFNNVQRCFAFVFNTTSNYIELHEILPAATTQTADSSINPIQTQFISRALYWKQAAGAVEWQRGGTSAGKNEFDLIKLEGGELAAQNITGKVQFQVEFKSVYDPNWHPWATWTVDNTNGQNGYQPRMGLGSPPNIPNQATQMYCHVDYAFQVRVTITGYCWFMGLRLQASPQPQPELAKPFKQT